MRSTGITADSNRILSRGALWCYSAGSLVETSIYGFCGLYLLNFYTDVVHLDPRLIGYAFAVRFLIDAVSDPAIGYLSDRTTSPLGRRRPYFLAGAIPAALAFYLLLTPPARGETATFAYLTITSSGLILALTIFGIPYYALAWELTSNYDERTRIAAYRRFVEVAAEILSTLTIPLLLLWSVGRNSSPAAEAQLFPTAALLIGGAAVIAALITFFGTTETNSHEARNEPGLRESVRAACRNKPFVILLVTFTLVAVADQVVTSLLLYLVEHLHGVPKQDANSLFLAFFAGSLASPPLWLFLGRYLGKKRAYALAILSWWATFTFFVAAPWPVFTLHAVGALMGATSSGVFLLPDALLPDVIEWGQSRSEQRHAGMYAGFAKFSWKIGTGACFFVVGHLLHAVGYDGETPPTAEVLGGLRLIFAGLPGVLLAAALLVFRTFPITAGSYRQVLHELDERQKTTPAAGDVAETT